MQWSNPQELNTTFRLLLGRKGMPLQDFGRVVFCLYASAEGPANKISFMLLKSDSIDEQNWARRYYFSIRACLLAGMSSANDAALRWKVIVNYRGSFTLFVCRLSTGPCHQCQSVWPTWLTDCTKRIGRQHLAWLLLASVLAFLWALSVEATFLHRLPLLYPFLAYYFASYMCYFLFQKASPQRLLKLWVFSLLLFWSTWKFLRY